MSRLQNAVELQAKVVVLGDPKVGKTSFVNNLNPVDTKSDDYRKFATVRIDANEFDINDSDLELKIWESGKGMDVRCICM